MVMLLKSTNTKISLVRVCKNGRHVYRDLRQFDSEKKYKATSQEGGLRIYKKTNKYKNRESTLIYVYNKFLHFETKFFKGNL